MKQRLKCSDVAEKSATNCGGCAEPDEHKSKTKSWTVQLSEMLPSDKAFEEVCGFRLGDLKNYEKFVALMYRPTNPASLGVARALFGLCMVIDIVEERGFSDIDLKWGDPATCHFPLIHGMKPPRLPWTIALYTLMWLGAGGIMIGFSFKLACGCFLLPYWYFFILDKMNWNNHSYLYGVVAILFWGTGANKYFSMDARSYRLGDNSVPLWNYFILKFQFFALYFLAGLKKSSKEWLDGYAMMNLSRHWVFDPFKLFLSTDQIDFLIVHWFAFLFDLTVGFWMLFDRTRLPAMVFCTSFHLMNSRLFHIGMFPYVCLATMPLFCHVDWPTKIEGWFVGRSKSHLRSDQVPDQKQHKNQCYNRIGKSMKQSDDFISKEKKCFSGEAASKTESPSVAADTSDDGRSQEDSNVKKCQDDSTQESDHHNCFSDLELRQLTGKSTLVYPKPANGRKKKLFRKVNVTKKQKFVVGLLLFHVFMQLFLPYSHFITKGYNNWVPGLYGYSWDMMVHSWDTILVVIKIHDNVHNEDHYLDPQAWVQGDRWSKHGDMVKQYAHCLKDNLMNERQKALTTGQQPSVADHWAKLSNNLSIYIDVWCSLNGRFLQRVFNPKVNLLTAEWHPFQPVSYLMPLMTQFSSYRNKLDEIQRAVYSWSNYTDVLFVADYPGMELENYIDRDLSNVTLTVLEGQVIYFEDDWQQGVTISKGNHLEISPGKFHNVQTISFHPACLMYTFTNGTKQRLEREGRIEPPEKPKDVFPILKEMRYKLNAWKRTLGHIAAAFFYFAYDVPMLRRVQVN
ncbi:vitamin K-dependent gamma-carboxylase [Diprion similis]|uniref:vitamin K-dependent gamma-carboxylase n=1 Tax=Diprion similis TaxID=362088 RepID=UPI001EF8DDC3|nr:vitamin K-dependent gamma-carboxylase [Diprion similis]XP_046752620.1 vitamin K-dependent gamma-carboxylase [Diprion similis]XP_046752621.1 vitamin K-dependent gamma-carboxylase [Diprion similis]